MASKIMAAVDARRDNMVVIARTDARAVDGFQAAIDRSRRYVEAGADVIFLEAPQSLDEVRQISRLLTVPLLLNIVVGGKTPMVSQSQATDMGFSLLLYANTALQGGSGRHAKRAPNAARPGIHERDRRHRCDVR
jgi:2-methylisocitrate lyase-like PEP mutase family enzyme